MYMRVSLSTCSTKAGVAYNFDFNIYEDNNIGATV